MNSTDARTCFGCGMLVSGCICHLAGLGEDDRAPLKIEFGVHLCEAGSRHAGWNYTVECKDCGADGPYAMTENAAITAWNTRAAPKVKPLPFEEYNLTGQHMDGYEMRLRALTRSGRYFIDKRLADGMFVVRLKIGGDEFSAYDTEVGAIKSANDEQKRRILSALTPETAEMRCAECDCENGGADCNWIKTPETET